MWTTVTILRTVNGLIVLNHVERIRMLIGLAYHSWPILSCTIFITSRSYVSITDCVVFIRPVRSGSFKFLPEYRLTSLIWHPTLLYMSRVVWHVTWFLCSIIIEIHQEQHRIFESFNLHAYILLLIAWNWKPYRPIISRIERWGRRYYMEY